MTSTLPHAAPAPAPVERALRTLTISVDLLPIEVVEARRVRRVRRLVLTVVAGFTALLAAGYGFATFQTISAQGELERVQTRAADLVQQQRRYAELSGVQAESRAIGVHLKGLFTEDLAWAPLLDGVQRAATGGVQVTGVNGNLLAVNGGAIATGSAVPNPSGKRIVGTMTVTGTAAAKPAIASYVDALGNVPGLANPLLSGVNVQGSTAHFTITADVTADTLGGRYATAKSKGDK